LESAGSSALLYNHFTNHGTVCQIPESAFLGIGAGLFAPTIISCVFLFFGMATAGLKSTGKVGSCCMWTSFVIGSLAFIFIVPTVCLPPVTPVVPMPDACVWCEATAAQLFVVALHL
jgi:hypothetical protein